MRKKTLAKLRSRELHGKQNRLRKLFRQGYLSFTQYALEAGEVYVRHGLRHRARILLESTRGHPAPPARRYCIDKLLEELRTDRSVPKISFNLIVLDEEKRLPAALDSIDGIAEEIVVCDTGSTDNTLEIARQYGARIIHCEWSDDFSTPRNRAIEASTGNWILWMDADDRLTPDSISTLRELLNSKERYAVAFSIENPTHSDSPFTFQQVRMFPRDPRVRFENRVHEQIMYSVQKAGIPFAHCTRVRFVHTGYQSSGELRRKLKRNLGLVAGELFVHPDCGSLRTALADTWMGMGEYRKAIRAYMMLCEDRQLCERNPDIYVQAHLNVAFSALRLRDARTARRFFYRALYLSPDRIEAKFHLGRMSEDQSEIAEAFAWYLDASRTLDSPRMTATNYRKYRMDSIVSLCLIMLRLSRFEEARRILCAAVEEFPLNGEMHALLGWCRIEGEQRSEALESFRNALRLTSKKGKTYHGMTFEGIAVSRTMAPSEHSLVR